MKIKIICFMFVIFISNFLYGKVIIDPGPDAYDRIQEALIMAQPNEIYIFLLVIMSLKMDFH